MTDALAMPTEARAVFEDRGPHWLDATARRHSRRAFDGVPLEPAEIAAIQDLTERWRPYPDARVELVTEPVVEVFTGAIGAYGRVNDPPHVLVFIVSGRTDFNDQHMGYTGQGIVLEVAARGLDTCWIGGYFNPRRVTRLTQLGSEERVLAVAPLGRALPELAPSERAMARLADPRRRMPLAEIAPDAATSAWPAWAIAAMETARLAPSAMNRQPWRFRLDSDGMVVSRDDLRETSKIPKRLDIGIAMLHVSLAAQSHGVAGHWVDLPGTDVARFVTAR
jgi:hypothetical protein